MATETKATATKTNPPANTKAAVAGGTSAPSNGAKPGTADAGAKDDDDSKARTPHPLVGNADANIYPFKMLPPDYDPKVHAPLKKKDFIAEHLFYGYRAQLAETAAKKFRQLEIDAQQLGGAKDRAAAKRFQKMSKAISELRQTLTAKGVDINALLAQLTAGDAAPAKK